jgi:hypothetical protein
LKDDHRTPGWVPVDLQRIASVVEESRLMVTLRDARTRVGFDEVPDKWTIEIVEPGRLGPVAISAAKPSKGIAWLLRQTGGHPVT